MEVITFTKEEELILEELGFSPEGALICDFFEEEIKSFAQNERTIIVKSFAFSFTEEEDRLLNFLQELQSSAQNHNSE